jgi:hypothetical protein
VWCPGFRDAMEENAMHLYLGDKLMGRILFGQAPFPRVFGVVDGPPTGSGRELHTRLSSCPSKGVCS